MDNRPFVFRREEDEEKITLMSVDRCDGALR